MANASRPWTEQDIPDLHGRTALVTGANSGIGFETARALAQHGARVLMACRDAGRGDDAVRRLHDMDAALDVHLVSLDLGSLASVRATAAAVLEAEPQLDLLINNAGVMAPPRRTTADGFEEQFGTNHLGHFALTGLLLPRLLDTKGSRVVTVSSNAHRIGRIDFDDLEARRHYLRWPRYGATKVANLLFTYELQRRLAAAGDGTGATTIAVACHPGVVDTNLLRYNGLLRAASRPVSWMIMQPARSGALPTLRAATDPAVRGGQYYGPDGFQESRGNPRLVRSSGYSHDQDVARRLWAVSEELTGVAYPL
jgi:NAD(P)-dependent dehydrogenase (short-subunit alcohol dehydrogenase family)